MKKILSLLISVAMFSAMFVTTAFAAEGNVSFSMSADEITVGETVVVTIRSNAKTIVSDAFYLDYDESKLDVTTFADDKDRTGDSARFRIQYYDDVDEANVNVSYDVAENNGSMINFGFAKGAKIDYLAKDVAKITFTAKEAGTVTFTLNEDTYDAAFSCGYTGVNQTATLTIKGNEPVLDEAIEVGATSTDDAEAGTRTWAVEVGADLIANGKIKAVLTNSHADVAADNTQEVALSFGTVDKDSEMDCQFNVVVKFQDYAKYAATTNLDIVKAN